MWSGLEIVHACWIPSRHALFQDLTTLTVNEEEWRMAKKVDWHYHRKG